MNRKEAEALQARLLALIGPEKFDLGGNDEMTRLFMMMAEISNRVDVIQKLARRSPGLTARCEFSQIQRVRRLLTIRPVAWRDLEGLWARQIIQAIETLQKESGPDVSLALACFGVWQPDLDEAIALAEKPKEASKPAEDQPVKSVKAKNKGAPAAQKIKADAPAEPPKVLGSLDTMDDDLDPRTLADLEILRAEVAALSTKG